MNLYRIDRITHNDVRNMAEYIGVSTATFVWAIDLLRERLVPVEPDATWFTIENPDDPRFIELWALGIVKPVPLDGEALIKEPA